MRCCQRTATASGRCSTSAFRRATSTLDRAWRHRAPGIGGELPAPGHHDDHGRRQEQGPGAYEPAEIAEREEERTLAAIEMPAGGFEQPAGADDVRLCLLGVALARRWHPSEQDRDVIEQAIGPREFEKR